MTRYQTVLIMVPNLLQIGKNQSRNLTQYSWKTLTKDCCDPDGTLADTKV